MNTDGWDRIEILLKVALDTVTLIPILKTYNLEHSTVVVRLLFL